MIHPEEIYCYHCEKIFYLHSFRFQEAKTVSCFFCGKRVDKKKSEKLREINEKGTGK